MNTPKLADQLREALAELYLNPMWETKNEVARLRIQLLLLKVEGLEAGWQPIETAPKDGTTILTCMGLHDWDIEICKFATWHPDVPVRAYWRNTLNGQKTEPKYWIPLPPRPTYDEEKKS